MTKIKNHAVISNFDADIRKAERKKNICFKMEILLLSCWLHNQLFITLQKSETALRFLGRVRKMYIICAISAAGGYL